VSTKIKIAHSALVATVFSSAAPAGTTHNKADGCCLFGERVARQHGAAPAFADVSNLHPVARPGATNKTLFERPLGSW
jgi:hypothetical protein